MKSEIPQEYKDGLVEFAGCVIDLSARTLIPRPETEFWVKQAIVDLAKTRGREIRVLDIFCGSGCAGVAAAKNLVGAKVDFADIDSAAINQAKINIDINGVARERTRFFKSDVFDDVPAAGYDAILANPPYIDPARMGEVQKSVLDWEPWHAFFAGDRGLALVKKFLARAKNYLDPDGFIYLEFDSSQKSDIMKLAKAAGYSSVKCFKDQFGVWRFAKIIR